MKDERRAKKLFLVLGILTFFYQFIFLATTSAKVTAPKPPKDPLADPMDLPLTPLSPEPITEPIDSGAAKALQSDITPPESALIPEPAPSPTPATVTPSFSSDPETATINSPEKYEEARLRQSQEMRTPHWAFQLWVSPLAHKRTEWRAAPYSGGAAVKNARMLDLILQGEKFLLRRNGMLSIGANVELMGQRSNNDFEKTLPAVYGVGVVSQYQFHYIHGQWVVPFIEVGATELRYNYVFAGSRIKGFKTTGHADVGLSIFLNFLEPSSAGDMYGNYGVRRTYLNASFGVTRDGQKSRHFDLSEENFKVGLRFEF